MLARLRKAQEENEGGFTLIELLVVVIIIGILSAIAIPTFLNQRQKAWQKEAMSDLRNAAVVAEEYFSDTGAGSYAAFAPETASKNGANVTLALSSGNKTGYCMSSVHASLPADADTYILDSATGIVTGPAADASACGTYTP